MLKDKLFLGAIAVILSLIAFAGVQQIRVRNAISQLQVAEADLAAAKSVNDNNVEKFETLGKAFQDCITGREADEKANRDVVDKISREKDRLRAMVADADREREAIFADAACAELGATDIALACPALAERLRRKARELCQDGDCARPGGSADTITSGVLREHPATVTVADRPAHDPGSQ
jgi:Zn-dependent protease with chaperone function